MSETQEMTFSDVADHNSKKDLFLVIHDKVYDATAFVDEHPYVHPIPTSPSVDNLDPAGGEEVLLDVGGQDATEAFEDVGHSDEARQLLDGMEKGKLKRMVWGSQIISLLFLPVAATRFQPQKPIYLPSFHSASTSS
ncbi:MAG: hypothetical protein Q9176_000108 [Flavoplaca citrina]